jgi:hypothetical protein
MNVRGHPRSPEHDARSQQTSPEPPPIHHHHEGDRRSQCGVVGGEPVVSRVGEQGLDRRVDDKRAGVYIGRRRKLDQHHHDDHRHYRLRRHTHFVRPREVEPDDGSRDQNEEEEVLADSDDEGIHDDQT